MGYLVGDCLVAAAFLSYAGPFLSNYRDDLVQDTWLKQVRDCSSQTYPQVKQAVTPEFTLPFELPTCILHCICSQVRQLHIPCAPDYMFATFLGKPTAVRDWNIQGLPSDGFSTENGVIVTKSNR